MALTPLRWTAILVAGCLLAVAYFYSPRERVPRPEDRRDVVVNQERQLGWAVTRAADRVRATVVIDSIRRAMPPGAAGDTMRILIDRGIPPAARTGFRDAARRALAALGNPRLPVDVAFVFDTTELVRGVRRGAGRDLAGEFVLPASDTDRCLAVVRIRSSIAASEGERRLTEIASRLTDRRLLGPCAFIGAFGPPGPHISDWLSSNGWGYALVAGWSEPFPSWNPPAWYGLRTGNSDGWPLRYYMGVDGYRCATGDERACVVAISETGAPIRSGALPRTWGTRVISSTQNDNDWFFRLNLGPRQATFLSDLVNTVGPDRFRRFWTSTEPVAEAFESATGRTLGAATYDWTQSQYAGYVGRGAAVSPLTAGLALLFVGGGAVTAVAAARRRRVR
ncbi:MAG TPA: hypothetical protein VFO66_04405 [Gemmatimonadaceae bacterium]|nr:hypothetical protein [Gemmatimonadaceae bacterium]